MKKHFLPFVLALLVFSCSNDTPTDDVIDDNKQDIANNAQNLEIQKLSAQNVFNSIPGPGELGRLVEEAGLDYDATFLNKPEALSKYSTDNFKALNLGVYGGDLAYTNVYEQSQESMIYLKCVNSLCKNLGIAKVFDDKTVDRLEANRDNKDSLLTIVSKSFRQADDYLRANQRPHTSSLMVAGGWIEGLYLSARVGTQSKSKKFIKKMSEQTQSLKDLITLVESAKVSGDADFVLPGLKDLLLSYQKIPANTTMDDAMLKEIDEKVSALRKKIIME